MNSHRSAWRTAQAVHGRWRGSLLLIALVGILAASCGSVGTDGRTEPGASLDSTQPSPSVDGQPTPLTSDADVEQAAAAFVASQTSANASELVEAIADNRGERWVPWLLDLLRINVSLQVSNNISDTLETITGIAATERIPNMITYGAWSQNNGLDGGDGYVDFKSTLYERIDPGFGDLIRSLDEPADVAAIQWGGVPLGGIPELNDPERAPAAEADWMVDDEIVLGVIANGEAVAYPLRILARHELANDTVGGEDLAIVYCTLCRTALVFERDVAGQKLDFLTSGLLLNSNKVMYDVQTGSLWNHLRGVGIGGELSGTELVVRPVNHMRWSDWVVENPETEVLALPGAIFFDDPERPPISYDYTPGEAYRSYYETTDVWFPILDVPDTFSIKTEVVGIERNGESAAFDVEAFNAIGQEQSIEVGGETLTIEPTGVGVRVFDEAGERVLSEQSFWFAWYANHPDTRTTTF